jgi:hypothetical protein
MKLLTINEKGDLIELDKLEFDNKNVYLIDDVKKNTVFIWVGLDVLQYKKDITAAWARKFDKDRGGACKILIMKQDREYGSFLSMMDELKKGLIPSDRPELILKEPTETPKPVFDIEPKIEEEDESGARISAGMAQFEEYNQLEIEAPVDKPDESVIVLESLGFEEIVEEEVEEIVEEEVEEVGEEDIDEEDEEEIGLESQIREGAYYLSLKKYSYNDLCWLLAETIQKINLGMPSLEEIRKKAEEVYNSSSTYDELCWLNAEMDLLIEQHFFEQ